MAHCQLFQEVFPLSRLDGDGGNPAPWKKDCTNRFEILSDSSKPTENLADINHDFLQELFASPSLEGSSSIPFRQKDVELSTLPSLVGHPNSIELIAFGGPRPGFCCVQPKKNEKIQGPCPAPSVGAFPQPFPSHFLLPSQAETHYLPSQHQHLRHFLFLHNLLDRWNLRDLAKIAAIAAIVILKRNQ